MVVLGGMESVPLLMFSDTHISFRLHHGTTVYGGGAANTKGYRTQGFRQI